MNEVNEFDVSKATADLVVAEQGFDSAERRLAGAKTPLGRLAGRISVWSARGVLEAAADRLDDAAIIHHTGEHPVL
jgi:hypothetical protein